MDGRLREVKSTLRRLIEENAGIPADTIEDDSAIDGDLAMDSFSFVSLQVAVEETFGVECAPEEIEERRDFDGIARLIVQKTAAKKGAEGAETSGGPAASRSPAAPIPLDEHRRGPARRS